jgi:hypothetical protein
MVGELWIRGPEFASLLSKHPVQNRASGTKLLHHPEVGNLAIKFDALHLADDSGQRILICTAAPETASDAALQVLQRQGPRGRPGRDRAAASSAVV